MRLTSIVPTRCGALKERNRSFGNFLIGCGLQRTKLSSISLWRTVAVRPEAHRHHRKAKFPWHSKTGAILNDGIRSVCPSSERTLLLPATLARNTIVQFKCPIVPWTWHWHGNWYSKIDREVCVKPGRLDHEIRVENPATAKKTRSNSASAIQFPARWNFFFDFIGGPRGQSCGILPERVRPRLRPLVVVKFEPVEGRNTRCRAPRCAACRGWKAVWSQ
jgi:hypothetical protein